jgi:glycosyltransferase involved in cell wall biosynthesis
MKLSLITVCYNSQNTILDTLNSVLNQTYHDYEYIVVDGNSQDNTLNILKDFIPKFKGRIKIVSEADYGLYDAMNKGIKIALGEVIGIINSDDFFCDNDALKKIMNAFDLDTTLDSVYADLYYVSQSDTSKVVRKWITGNRKPFNTGWHPAHPTLYIKKKVFNDFGLFNLNFKLAADFELMLRFFDKYQISSFYLREPLVKMRLGGKTNKSLKNIFNQNIECSKSFSINNLEYNRFLYPFYRLIPKIFQF